MEEGDEVDTIAPSKITQAMQEKMREFSKHLFLQMSFKNSTSEMVFWWKQIDFVCDKKSWNFSMRTKSPSRVSPGNFNNGCVFIWRYKTQSQPFELPSKIERRG